MHKKICTYFWFFKDTDHYSGLLWVSLHAYSLGLVLIKYSLVLTNVKVLVDWVLMTTLVHSPHSNDSSRITSWAWLFENTVCLCALMSTCSSSVLSTCQTWNEKQPLPDKVVIAAYQKGQMKILFSFWSLLHFRKCMLRRDSPTGNQVLWCHKEHQCLSEVIDPLI